MKWAALALLLMTAPAAAQRICDPQFYTPAEWYCLRNPSSCDPVPYWQRLSLRCAGYLRRLERRPLQRLGNVNSGVARFIHGEAC